MRNSTFDIPGARTRTFFNGSSPQVTSKIRFHDSVLHGPIVHGNHHDAYAWSYTIDQYSNWYTTMPDSVVLYKSNGDKQFVDSGDLGTEIPNTTNWELRSTVYNLALSKLNEKVRGSLDIGLDLVEGGQTIRMFRATAKVLNFARSLKRFAYFDRRDVQSVANGWLEWQYGWRPLVQDVFDGAAEVQNVVMSKIQRVQSSATIPSRGGYGENLKISDFNAMPATGKRHGKTSCRFSIAFDTSGHNADRFSSLNPVSLAWEVIPYSFVVDWFINIGGYLRDLETGLLYNNSFKGGYCSELFVEDIEATCDYVGVISNFAPLRGKVEGVQCSRHQRRFSRSILSSYPLPRLPSFKANLGWQRLTSAAALLDQLLKPVHR